MTEKMQLQHQENPVGAGLQIVFFIVKKNINSNNNNKHRTSTNIHSPSESCRLWPFIPSRILHLSVGGSFNRKAPSCFSWAGTAAPLAWPQSSLRGCSGLPSPAGPWDPGAQGSQECLADPLARLHPSCHNLEALEDLKRKEPKKGNQMTEETMVVTSGFMISQG